jgi:hypothetical protein
LFKTRPLATPIVFISEVFPTNARASGFGLCALRGADRELGQHA